MRRRVEDAVQENNVKGILTISAAGYAAAYEYLEDNGYLCTTQRNINNSDCVLLATFDETDEILQVCRSYDIICIYEEAFRESWTVMLPLRWTTSSTYRASWPFCFSESVPAIDSFLASDDRS